MALDSVECDGFVSACRDYSDMATDRCADLGSCKASNTIATCTSFVDVTSGTDCGICAVCDGVGACSVAPADDDECGVLDCNGLDKPCRDYSDMATDRCAELGSCKASNTIATCTSFVDATSGTDCGTCAVCDDAGACSEAPADDHRCGVLDCDELDTTCRNYSDITTNRCAAAGVCKEPNSDAACTGFVDAAFGTACGSAYCSGTVLFRADMCGVGETSGRCNDGGSQECAPYLCHSGACTTSCQKNADCALGNYCDGEQCRVKKTIGALCADGSQCQSSNCVDSVCCSTDCAGVCASCVIAGSVGTCSPVPAGSDPDGECSGAGTCGGTCNGMGACTAAKPGEPCGSCRTCNADGRCIAVANGTSCEGTLFCATGETCSGGACAGTLDPNCGKGSDAAIESADAAHTDEPPTDQGCSCAIGRWRGGNGGGLFFALLVVFATGASCAVRTLSRRFRASRPPRRDRRSRGGGEPSPPPVGGDLRRVLPTRGGCEPSPPPRRAKLNGAPPPRGEATLRSWSLSPFWGGRPGRARHESRMRSPGF
ncbi:MAG: hypothetical protein V2A73_04610, partial [Pseudomonadota bacterium]